MVKTLKNYTIMGKLELEIFVEISAQSLEDALEQSKTLKEDDFVKMKGDYMDGNLHISGVMEAD